MARAITINRPDVVELVELAANRLTKGNKTEAVQLAVRTLLDSHARRASLFGVLRGSVRVKPGVDLVAPVLTDPVDAETNRGAAKFRPKA